jgi:hypothetical protein
MFFISFEMKTIPLHNSPSGSDRDGKLKMRIGVPYSSDVRRG